MRTSRFFFIMFIATLFSTMTNAQLSADKLKSITIQAFDDLGKHDIDKFIGYMSEDAIDYQQAQPIKGREAVGNNLKMFFNAFPDYKIDVTEIAVTGNKVFIRNTFTGTQTANFFGMIPPTGKMIKWTDTDIIEYNADGKISAHWASNSNEPLVQLGYAAFTNPNTYVVMSAYEAFGKGDIKSILSQCSDDVVFDVTDPVYLPNGMKYSGKMECANYFKTLSESIMVTKFEPYRFLADGDDVVAFIHSEAKNLKTGKNYSTTLVHHFKVVNGKVSWFKACGDAPKEIMAMSAK